MSRTSAELESAETPETPAVIHDLSHPAADEIELTGLFGALAEPARLTVLKTLDRHGELSCTEIWTLSGIGGAKSTMSHHYKVMREAGLVFMHYVGSRKYVSIRRAELDARFPGLLDAVLRTESKD
jgi:DNA-binding transcriptional ArsR family regulator